MRLFNCTVKDLAFRGKAIEDLTSSMAANGYQDARADYMIIKGHWNDALNCASMKTFYNSRTVRRYIREFCECVRNYYLERFDISLADYC